MGYLKSSDYSVSSMRSSGAGGQHVNKVETGVLIRMDIHASSLPEAVKQRLLKMSDSRITADGVVLIKSTRHRSQAMNRSDALRKLEELIEIASVEPKKRKRTRVPKAVKEKRLSDKKRRGETKSSRRKPLPPDGKGAD